MGVFINVQNTFRRLHLHFKYLTQSTSDVTSMKTMSKVSCKTFNVDKFHTDYCEINETLKIHLLSHFLGTQSIDSLNFKCQQKIFQRSYDHGTGMKKYFQVVSFRTHRLSRPYEAYSVLKPIWSKTFFSTLKKKTPPLRFEKLLEFANIKFENHQVCNTVHQPFIQSKLKRFKHLVEICNFKVNFAVKNLLLIGQTKFISNNHGSLFLLNDCPKLQTQ